MCKLSRCVALFPKHQTFAQSPCDVVIPAPTHPGLYQREADLNLCDVHLSLLSSVSITFKYRQQIITSATPHFMFLHCLTSHKVMQRLWPSCPGPSGGCSSPCESFHRPGSRPPAAPLAPSSSEAEKRHRGNRRRKTWHDFLFTFQSSLWRKLGGGGKPAANFYCTMCLLRKDCVTAWIQDTRILKNLMSPPHYVFQVMPDDYYFTFPYLGKSP